LNYLFISDIRNIIIFFRNES